MGVPLAVVAAGTANDFARSQGLPLDIEEACALARDPNATTRHAELALAGDRPFVNAAATGLSVVAAKEARPHKSRLGPLAYAVGARQGRRDRQAAALQRPLRRRQTAADGRAWQVVVGATGAFGGGSEMGGTRPDDGLLDVAVVPAGSRVGLARRAFGMRRGRLTEQSDVAHHRGATIDVDVRGRLADVQRRRGGLPVRAGALHAARRRLSGRRRMSVNKRWPAALAALAVTWYASESLRHRREQGDGYELHGEDLEVGSRGVPARRRGDHELADRARQPRRDPHQRRRDLPGLHRDDRRARRSR